MKKRIYSTISLLLFFAVIVIGGYIYNEIQSRPMETDVKLKKLR